MFYVPSDSPHARIIGIDPGSEMLGVSCLTIDVRTLDIINTQACTFTGSKLNMNLWMEQIHSTRFSRIAAHKENLKHIFQICQPVAIVCESPFYNPRRPNAYGVLVETLDAIRHSVWEYDQCIPLDLIDPPTVKRAVGGKGNADKIEMKRLVLSLPDLNFTGTIPLECVDEHAIDAIAVAYSRIIHYRTAI